MQPPKAKENPKQCEYWYDNLNHHNKTLTSKNGFYQSEIFIPSNTSTLNYFLSSVDNSNNWAKSYLKELDIIDNIKPSIADLSGIPTTGDDYEFSFKFTDNIGISTKYLEYWFDNHFHSSIKLTDDNNHTITIQKDVEILQLEIHQIIRYIWRSLRKYSIMIHR